MGSQIGWFYYLRIRAGDSVAVQIGRFWWWWLVAGVGYRAGLDTEVCVVGVC